MQPFIYGGLYMNRIYKTYYDSPIGILEIKGTEQGIFSIMFVDKIEESIENPIVTECSRQLDEYFLGILSEFSFPMVFEGTEFQKKVWKELMTILYGETVSYKDIAELIGNVKAVRAAANANSRNLLSIVVPCHRVIGSNGSLTGYAGGLWRKQWLIDHEMKNKKE